MRFVENLKILGIIFDQNGVSNTNLKKTVENNMEYLLTNNFNIIPGGENRKDLNCILKLYIIKFSIVK